MSMEFSDQLRKLRTRAQLTNKELAQLAAVPESLISGLQNNNRRVGELQARKIGRALNLAGDDLANFVLQAINTCTEKILNEAKGYPAQLLNFFALQLSQAGISADSICEHAIVNSEIERRVILTLKCGSTATLKTQLVCA